MGDTIGLLAFPGFIILIGVIILSFAFIHLRRGVSRKSWTRIEGEIIQSEVQSRDAGDGDRIYDPIVAYRYKVNLAEYTSSVITESAPLSVGTQRYAKKLVEKYQVNTKVDVYYNPDKPEEAVLDPRTSVSGMILIATLGTAVLLCGFGFLYILLANNP